LTLNMRVLTHPDNMSFLLVTIIKGKTN
jgi:hypothetical protein